ncbi:hypothetical protein [Syntrophorhabdus aromaticivorans]|jgi:ClpP class serine protease|uniref:Uncharacterized protein n=1 Tax=Syntrophorhabdus aromaticivorans TaxID=328301 RepID=A0A971S032_9BACT|nr:hypothetical protein [Syntrophorhabdus aromaticivorans]NLW34758.1 hypothetical protein [Syntrophorhabdus aromaticivorans]
MVESLVDNIVALEREADALIEESRLEAKRIKLAAETDLARFRDELARDRDDRLANLKKEFDRKYQEGLRAEEDKLADGLNAIDQIPDTLVRQQIERILNRFREW